LIDAVLKHAVSPLITKLSDETKQSIEFQAIAKVEDRVLTMRPDIKTSSTGGTLARGEVRILLKDPVSPSRFLVESIFKDLSPGSGFSGFFLRGRAVLEGGEPTVRITGHSNRYNVWTWGKEFQFSADGVGGRN
jgi:hypothetical protein